MRLAEGTERALPHGERLQLEEQCRQGQRLEAIGQLAGGIAHDFNNILTAILGTANLALLKGQLAEDVEQSFRDITEAGRRAADITRQLLVFSRHQRGRMRPVSLAGVTRGVMPMLRRLTLESMHLESESSATGTVLADSTQLEQVVMNLVVNARDAIDDHGTIRVTTCDEEVLHRQPNADANIPPGPYCVLSVRDDGVGMDAATKARIFEPFFTTKPTGKGTGLGLSTVYGIVRQASGHIQVSSDLGVGTEFRIYFPRLPAEEHEAPLINREIDLDGDETVLIVEDHEQVRSLLTGAFRSRGYSVLEARDGADALNVLAAHSAPIHLVISDVVMPEMNGLDLVVLLRTWYPEVRALLVSGYSDEVTRLHGGLPDGVFYLPKPFTAGEVLVRARHILDAS